MDVYLMQHGEAVSADVDPERPLEPTGQANVAAVAARAALCGVRIDRIRHSDKLRAVQTAQLLGRTLACADVAPAVRLHPNDAVEVAAFELVDPAREGSIAIVGHLPFLDRLAAHLVTGDQSAQVVSFRNAALVKLVPAADPVRFAVAWVLPPELALP